ncbi:MAG: hypothetical protein KDK39_08770 [Leptospiraceae bacterium]|nr:hypothetical protein [Leptospiraceae bacterium]
MAATLPDTSRLTFKTPKGLQTTALVLIGLGVILTLIQILVPGWEAHHAVEAAGAAEAHGPSHLARMWMSIHLAVLVAFPLGVGGVFFSAISHVAGARWAVTTRRLTENFFWYLAVPLLLMLVVFIGGIGDVFGHWVHAPASDELIAHKSAWLNVPFFIVRNIGIVLVWFLFGFYLWKKSVSQDEDGAVSKSRSMANMSALFLVVFGLSYSAHAFDLGMSLEPHWFSTLFAVYVFSGMALTTFAAIILWVSYLKSLGYFGDSLNENHFHDYGKYLFGFTIFWAYMAISQYMLIWYAGIPEETGFFFVRTEGAWWYATIIMVALRFVLPFFLLLKREVKRNYRYMQFVAVLILIGQVVDMYVLAYPTLDHGHFIMLSWQEVGPLLFVAGAFIIITARALEKAPLVPLKDPRLEDCLHFHQ